MNTMQLNPITMIFRRLPVAQQGQSFTEMAIFMPIISFFLLIAVNLGLALRAHTALTQATQQAAQYLLQHPIDPSTCADAHNCTAPSLVSYLDGLGFHGAAVTVDLTQQTPSGAQKAVISVSYPFPVIVPILDTLSVGPFDKGSVTLGARAATIAATIAPTPTVTQNGSAGYLITLHPLSAGQNPAGLTLEYRLYAFTTPITSWLSLSGDTQITDNCANGGSSGPACTTAPSQYYSYYEVVMQQNGMQTSSTSVEAP